MVDKPTPDNPSAKWTNFTDGSCQRLIYVPNNYAAARYLLGCDAVDCCTEEESGNHKEYQIPDVHPAWLARVTGLGKESIKLFNGTTVEADAWSWKTFGIATTVAYTVGGNNLVRWNVSVPATTKSFVSDFVDFTVPKTADEIAAFKSQFRVPDVCQRAMSCGGRVSAKSLAFLRAGQGEERRTSPMTTRAQGAAFSARALKAAAGKAPHVEKPDLRSTPPSVEKSAPSQPAAGKTLLFVNDSRIVGDPTELSELVSIDLTTKAMRKISTSMPSEFDYVSGSVACGSKYYAVATMPPAALGMVEVDMASGNTTLLATEGNLMHALACSPTAGKLMAVVSAFTQGGPTFSLREYDVATQTTRVIYTFPHSSKWGGWDSTFSLARKGELWATFPLGRDIMKYERGELYIIDTATGAVKEHKTVGRFDTPGEPYLIVPAEGDTFQWMLAPKGAKTAAQDLQLCTADKSGRELEVKDCKPAADLWAIGAVPALCGDSLYIGALGMGGPVPIYEVSPAGEYNQTTSVDIRSSHYVFGTLACGPGA